MDSTVSTATAAALTLQARRCVGRPLRWMEHVKMERLKQVNGALCPMPPPRGATLPIILGKGSCVDRPWEVSAPPPPFPLRPEPGGTELTVLGLLPRDRRDSSGSGVSSAYLSGSRRSSGISPCFSSRRSSQGSQSDRRLHNLSSTDSYDPISTDASRRSSEASQGGGGCGGGGGGGGLLPGSGWVGVGGVGGCPAGVGSSRGMLSLTPAQHYHLKAKYAAATGGPPPTPLPNMERMSLKTRMAVMEAGEGGNQVLPPLVRPRRCSDGSNGYANGYGDGYGGGHTGHPGHRRRVLYPGEGPAQNTRRASDPVRFQATDVLGLPQVQRFNSLNALHPLPLLSAAQHPAAEGRGLQNAMRRSEGNLPRGLQHSPCGPSIMEHSTLEALAMDQDLDAALLLGDEDVLPDDLLQYLRCHADGGSFNNMEDGYESRGLQEEQQQQQATERRSPSKLPIQWNEVSSGSAQREPVQARQCGRWQGSQPAPAPFSRFGNMVQQQQQQQLPRDFHNSCANPANQPPVTCRVKMEASANACMEMRASGNTPAQSFGRPDLSEIPAGPRACSQGLGPQSQNFFQHHHNGSNNSCRVGHNLLLSRASAEGLSSIHAISQAPTSRLAAGDSYRIQQYLTPETTEDPQPGGNQCSLALQVSGLKLEAPDTGYLAPGFSEQLCFEPGAPPTSSAFPGSENQCSPESVSELAGPGTLGVVGGPTAMLSPGSDQVTSTVDGSVSGVLDEVVSLDFGAMLEDGYDQSSLVSGVMSPSVFQGLSRTSSRLTTPRASAAFHGLPPGANNMAIGDMSSLLTTLAEESKFLVIMQ